MTAHSKQHAFTGNTDHDFTGLASGELMKFDGSGISSAGAVLWSASTGANSIVANNGTGNYAYGNFSIVAGQSNSGMSYYSAVIGGTNNKANSQGSFIGGGYGNYTNVGNYASIIGSMLSTASGRYSSIIGGRNNTVSDYNSAIVAGSANTVSSKYSFIGGGKGNLVFTSSTYSSVIGGHYNSVTGADSSAVGGRGNLVSSSYASIIGGKTNGFVKLIAYFFIYLYKCNLNLYKIWSKYIKRKRTNQRKRKKYLSELSRLDFVPRRASKDG